MEFSKLLLLSGFLIMLCVGGCTPVATFPDNYIDNTDQAIRCISSTHSMIHKGKHFKYENFFKLSNGETRYYVIYTNDTQYHFNYYISFEYGEGEFNIYEGAQISALGSVLPSYNSNRNSNLSAVGMLYSNPNIVNKGLKLFGIRLGQRRESGEISRADNEIILKNNTYYILEFKNYNTGGNIVNLRLIGYEN